MHRNSALVLAVLAAACKEKPPTVLTEVSIELPPNDDAAAEEWGTLRVQVWPAGTACADLRTWLARDCAGTDPAPLELWDDRAVEIPRGSPAPEVALDGSGAWDVAAQARKRDAGPDDEAFLFGCAWFSAGEQATVHLWRSWRDADACAGLYHSACTVDVDCVVQDGGLPDDPGRPTCQSLDEEVLTWEEDGVSCSPDGGVLPYPCAQALVRCEPDASVPIVDGFCPKEGEPPCSMDPADDWNCNGRAESSCVDAGIDAGCVPGSRIECGQESRTCFAGTATCEDGVWGDCVRHTEECDGQDDDCDGLPDREDDDAHRTCQQGDPPLADHCADDGCRCGRNDACGRQERCCQGECIGDDVGCDLRPAH